MHYGLRCSLNYLDYLRWSCHWRDRETVDARERSRRLHRYDSARHRGRAGRHVARSPFYGRELRRWLDHVDPWRNDPFAAVSIAFQARRIKAHLACCSDAYIKHRTTLTRRLT